MTAATLASKRTTAADAKAAIDGAKDTALDAAGEALMRARALAAELKACGELDLLERNIKSDMTSFAAMVETQAERVSLALNKTPVASTPPSDPPKKVAAG